MAALLLLALSGVDVLPLVQAKPDPARVDEAVARGVRFLKPMAAAAQQDLELILLALVTSNVAPGDPALAAPLERAAADDPRLIYRVALLAMVLEEVDRLRYQPRIARCAQFILDSQGQDGRWSYGRPTTYPQPMEEPTTSAPAGELAIFEEPRPGAKPEVKRRICVKQQRLLEAVGDNSNTAYAALGLRACHDAGIRLPVEAVERAAAWWRACQDDKGAWGYHGKGGASATMTAGAVGARAILLNILGKEWREDPVLNGGVRWLGANITLPAVKSVSGYYLYGLERAGMLCEIERFGAHDWYAEGAAQLLPNQKANGSWGSTTETAFALLFLRRATRSMVESGR